MSHYVLNIWDRKLKNVYDWHMGLLCRVHSLDEIEYLNFAVSHIHTTAAEIEVVLHVE